MVHQLFISGLLDHVVAPCICAYAYTLFTVHLIIYHRLLRDILADTFDYYTGKYYNDNYAYGYHDDGYYNDESYHIQ